MKEKLGRINRRKKCNRDGKNGYDVLKRMYLMFF